MDTRGTQANGPKNKKIVIYSEGREMTLTESVYKEKKQEEDSPALKIM